MAKLTRVPEDKSQLQKFVEEVCDDVSRIDETLKLKADLKDGKIPADELPPYVDDVLEYNTRSDFPEAGENGKLYIAKDTNLAYRYDADDKDYVRVGDTYALLLKGNYDTMTPEQFYALKVGDLVKQSEEGYGAIVIYNDRDILEIAETTDAGIHWYSLQVRDDSVVINDEKYMEWPGPLEVISQEDFLKLANDNKLVPGKSYRVHYNPEFSGSGVSAHHSFDIIVKAVSENMISPYASAMYNDERHDDYFKGLALDKWELRVRLESDDYYVCSFSFNTVKDIAGNDASFNITTKGLVVTYMKDEWNNEAPYDFKNLKFKVKSHSDFGFEPCRSKSSDIQLYTFGAYDSYIEGYVDMSVLNGIVFGEQESGVECYGNKIDNTSAMICLGSIDSSGKSSGEGGDDPTPCYKTTVSGGMLLCTRRVRSSVFHKVVGGCYVYEAYDTTIVDSYSIKIGVKDLDSRQAGDSYIERSSCSVGSIISSKLFHATSVSAKQLRSCIIEYSNAVSIRKDSDSALQNLSLSYVFYCFNLTIKTDDEINFCSFKYISSKNVVAASKNDYVAAGRGLVEI